MARRLCVAFVVCMFLLLPVNKVESGGVITFQVEVIPGVTIESPDNLVFEPVAPGQSTEQNLSLTVWANFLWELSVRSLREDAGENFFGDVEVQDENGVWYDLFARRRIIRSEQSSTGALGKEISVPFRFKGSFDDEPGTYSFEVEFTVVPAL